MIFPSRKPKSNKNRKPSYLSIDIGTEFVKTALFVVEGGEVQIIDYNRMKQKESYMYAAFIINLMDVVDTVDKSIGEAVKMAHQYFETSYLLPKEVIIGIAGELVQGVTVLVNMDRDNPDKIIEQSEI